MNIFTQYKGLRKENYILCLGRMVTNMGAMVWPVMTLILNQKLGMNATEISLIEILSGVVILPLGIIGGKLADRFNKKMIIVYADAVSILFFLAAAFIPLTIKTVVLMVVASAFQSLEQPAYSSLIADITSTKDRERAYSLAYLGANLGLVASPTIAGILFQNYLWLSFLICGAAIGCSTLLILFFVKDISVEVGEDPSEEYQKADEKASVWQIFRENKLVLFYVLVMGLFWTVYSEWGYVIPLDLGRIHGEGGALIFGTITSVNCIVVVVLTPVLTRLFAKVRKTVQTFIGSLLIPCGFLIFLLFLGKIPFYYVSIVLFTMGEIAVTVVSDAYITERVPASHRGRINGVRGFLQNMMYGVVIFFTGILYDGYGSRWAWAFIFLLGFLVVLGCLYLIYKDKAVYSKLYE
ncbi:MAG: MFS transporter [Lachnospiraceae bacterium]